MIVSSCRSRLLHPVPHKWHRLYERAQRLKIPLARCLLLSVAGVKTGAAETFSATTPSGSGDGNGTVKSSSGPASIMPMSFEANDPRLSSSECLKNAVGLAVDSSSAVLSQAVYAITKIEQQYVELLNVLVLLMEYQLQVLGHKAEEERMADLILETRHEISQVYKRKQDLDLLFASVVKLADATAEVAFAAGATYASTSTGERLHSAQCEVQRVQALSQTAERNLQMTQVKSVEVMTKHEDKEEKHRKEEEERKKKSEMNVAETDKEPVAGEDCISDEKTDGGNVKEKSNWKHENINQKSFPETKSAYNSSFGL